MSLRILIPDTDHLIGQLLQHLEKVGLRQDTVIIFVGDNGSSTGGTLGGVPMPAAKGTRLSDLAVHVPLIVHGPGLVRAGVVSSRLTSITDILPTKLEFAGFRKIVRHLTEPPTDLIHFPCR